MQHKNSCRAYEDNTLPIEERVKDLVSRMTLEEKVSQMVHDAPAIDRLGIPAHNWWNECLHGVAFAGVATVFPQAIGLAAMWDADLMHRIATAISDEARAKHHYAARQDVRDIFTGLTFWSPNVNLFRDPRWGRGQETYGECPCLSAQMGVAFVKGLQGDDPKYLKLVSTPKHYVVHSGPEPDRHHFDAQASEADLRETYLPAFEACVKEAGATSVMGAYNRTNGEPCCASPTLLHKVLRKAWGFGGYVVSDCWAIRDIYAHHNVVETPEEAAAVSVQAGCDLNCGSTFPALCEAVRQGLIDEATIDQAVRRLFRARFRLGMFDPPEQVSYTQIPYEVVDAPEHRALALQAAREAIVLLKNEGDLLPLSKDIASIAVIGPNADDMQVLMGNYHGYASKAVTPLEGIRAKLAPTTKLYTAEGCPIVKGEPPHTVVPSSALRPLRAAGNRRGLTAAYYDNPEFEGEPVLTRVDPIVDFVWEDSTPFAGAWGQFFGVRWTGYLVPPVTGTYRLGVRDAYSVQLYLDGALVMDSRHGFYAKLYSIEVELEAGRLYEFRLDCVNRRLDPRMKLVWSVPTPDDGLERAVEMAEKADVVVMVMGLSATLEGEELRDGQGHLLDIEGFHGGDRTDLGLPGTQRELLRRVHALSKPIVLVLMNGSALAVDWAKANVPAIVEAWYPGEEGGMAIADVLFGDYNPGGRLPVTFYTSVDDLPPFEDYAMDGHTYRYFRGEPLFPFGHGLSYTTFSLDNLEIARPEVEVGGEVAVRVEVINTGERAGDDVVQLYTRHHAAAYRPIKELKGFKRITLQPGERKTVTFILHTYQLGFYDEQFVVQPGTVEVMVGHSSQDLPLSGQFAVTGQRTKIDAQRRFFSRVRVNDTL
jgi:beta-glucosidase